MDADDYIDLSMYEILHNTIQKDGSDIAHAGYYNLIGETAKELPIYYSKKVIYINDKTKQDSFVHNYVFSPRAMVAVNIVTKLFKTDIIRRAYSYVPDDQQIGEDQLSFLFYCAVADSISLLPLPLYYYRSNPYSMMHGKKVHIISELGKLINFILSSNNLDDLGLNLEEKNDLVKVQLMTMARMYDLKYITNEISYIESYFDKKVVIFGAGKVGIEFYKQLRWYQRINVVAVADNNSDKMSFPYTEVQNPQIIIGMNFDYVIISVKDRNSVIEIRNWLTNNGVQDNKIIDNYF